MHAAAAGGCDMHSSSHSRHTTHSAPDRDYNNSKQLKHTHMLFCKCMSSCLCYT